jgi:hypothetical protein
MPPGKMPGADGLPADWYRAYGTEIAPLLRAVYDECAAAGEMTPLMRSATISLIFKQKGTSR